VTTQCNKKNLRIKRAVLAVNLMHPMEQNK
jgi:hypothetical protein